MLVRLIAAALLLTAASFGQDTWKGVSRVVAVGDVHGDLGQFTTLLRQAKVIDQKDRWSGGATHLVQVGDIPDRGPDTAAIYKFLMRLEKQARKAGGMVHPLIGNHDAMNIYGDLRYVTPEEFEAFKSSGSKGLRNQAFELHVADLAMNPQPGDPAVDDLYREEWDKAHPLGYYEHRNAYHVRGDFGRWIREHNTVIQIDDTLFLHGGISPRYGNWALNEINQQISSELRDLSMVPGGVAVDPVGPLWYRGLAVESEEKLAPHVDAVLAKHGAKRIVIGHTPTVGAVMSRFGGKVLMIDVGLSAYYGSRMACLIIEDGRAYALHRGTRVELPKDGSVAELQRYLTAAAELEPGGSALRKAVADLDSGSAPVLARPDPNGE
jgi:hypothetical protein